MMSLPRSLKYVTLVLKRNQIRSDLQKNQSLRRSRKRKREIKVLCFCQMKREAVLSENPPRTLLLSITAKKNSLQTKINGSIIVNPNRRCLITGRNQRLEMEFKRISTLLRPQVSDSNTTNSQLTTRELKRFMAKLKRLAKKIKMAKGPISPNENN